MLTGMREPVARNAGRMRTRMRDGLLRWIDYQRVARESLAILAIRKPIQATAQNQEGHASLMHLMHMALDWNLGMLTESRRPQFAVRTCDQINK